MSDTKWRDTGFGGSRLDLATCQSESWQRLVADVDVSRNADFIRFHVRFPGDEKPHMISMVRREVQTALDADHLERTVCRTETDVPVDVAMREIYGA